MNIRQRLDLISCELDSKAPDIEKQVRKLSHLTSLMGTSSECVSEAKAGLGRKKADKINALISNGEYEKYSPTVLKEIINADCVDEQELFDLAERLNASLVHSIDGIRSIISLYKTELEKSV